MSNIRPIRKASEVQEFLTLLWPEIPEQGRILIWTLPDKRSAWPRTVEEAAAQIAAIHEKDIYIGVGLAGEDYGPKRRCESAAILGIPGFYLDIDIAGPGRKKKNLFTSREEAEEFIASLPFKPTIIVWSGGGFQPWWLFEEPWIFEDHAQRMQAEELSHGWNAMARKAAAAIGREIDSTWDLARVLRVPGTINYKNSRSTPVTLLVKDGPRYDSIHFEDWQESVAHPTIKVEGLKLSGDASPPFDKWEALSAIDTELVKIWEKKKRALIGKSQSQWDMSLANKLAFAGWGPQEITDSLIGFRKKHGEDLKLREDYYRRTVQSALSAYKVDSTAAAVEVILDKASRGEEVQVNDAEREEILNLIEATTGVRIAGIVQHGDESPQYAIRLNGERNLAVGGVAKLTRFETWLNLAMMHGGKIPARPKPGKWTAVLAGLKALMEVETSDDTRRPEIVRNWIGAYSEEAVTMDKANSEALAYCLRKGRPFKKKETLFIQLDEFRNYLRLTRKEAIESTELLYLFKAVGLTPKKMQVREGQQIVTRGYWAAPLARMRGERMAAEGEEDVSEEEE